MDNLTGFSQDSHPIGNMSKVERYKWKTRDELGQFRMIDKSDLNIDRETYQRIATQSKVQAITKEWSWVGCGAISVAQRPDGTYWVMDGQHRKIAADRRSDIKKLPCLVFQIDDVSDEAKGFLSTNTLRKPMRATEKFKAELACGDEVAIKAQRFADAARRKIVNGTADGRCIQCITSLKKCINMDEESLSRIWPTLVTLMEGRVFHERIMMGMFYLETRMEQGGESLSDRKWRNRIANVGYDKILDFIMKASAFYTKGGEKVWARGIVEAINYHARNKLEVSF